MLAIAISLHQVYVLFNSISDVIPVRYIFGAFMCLQFFIGPVLAYNGLDQYQFPGYRMQVSETTYFLYAIPGVLAFIFGLHLGAGNLKGEHIDVAAIKRFVDERKNLPYIFIGIGFLSSIVSAFVPSTLAFVLYIIGSAKFVGLYMLLFGSADLKFWPMVLVIGSIVSSSLGQGMFHDLLTWLIFTGCVICIRYRFGTGVKLGLSIAFVFLAVVIQQLKTEVRQLNRAGTVDIETFADLYYKQQKDEGIFSFQSLAPSNVRINQGFIITNIMKTVPERVPFANGKQLMQILEAAFLPRFLAPNKLEAGDRVIFTKYSGINVSEGTSMGLSSLGDAYINFGILGGCVFMFVLGWCYNLILKVFHAKSAIYPILILFSPLVFYFPIRPDSELQTSLGHVVKSCFIIAFFFWYFSSYLKADEADEAGEEEVSNELATATA